MSDTKREAGYRLAQRVPVRIRSMRPDGARVLAELTAAVQVHSRTHRPSSCFSRLRAMVLEDLQIANRVRQRITEPRLDPDRRERVEFFAIRFRQIKLV